MLDYTVTFKIKLNQFAFHTLLTVFLNHYIEMDIFIDLD